MNCKMAGRLWLLPLLLVASCEAIQKFSEQPRYQEVNPHGSVVMPCVIFSKTGECRWEKDGSPIGIFPTKYEWAGVPEQGDCSLRIIDANLDYDDGVWQCQVTASSFPFVDTLISEGGELVVREKPNKIVIQRIGDRGQDITASAGEDLELECIATGGNPAPTLRWYTDNQEILSGHTQENNRPADNVRTWISISRLILPVSKSDNGATVRCVAEHPALHEPLADHKFLTIHYPPFVVTETTSLANLEEEKDSVTLRCTAESNPPAKVWWEKEGTNGIFSPDGEISISPVTRNTAGVYKCVAENAIGMSEPAFVDLDVKYAPSIASVGPSKHISAHMYNTTMLTCSAEGNPPPRYQWLQKLPTHEVLVRGYTQHLLIDNVTYDHQGEFVCKAVNVINGEQRSVQSEPIIVEVTGAPQVTRFGAIKEVIVGDGEDALLEVRFCADPLPEQLWHLGSAGDNIILTAGSKHGRFMVETVRKIKEDCYVSALRISAAQHGDSHTYELRLSNNHGTDKHAIHLEVREHLSPEVLIAIAVVVGCVLTILILTLFILYAVRAEKCCCGIDNGKKKPSDIESDKTDIESTHSSNMSAYRDKVNGNNGNIIIPPDALYATTEKQQQQQQNFQNTLHRQQQKFAYVDQADFNDSKESLKPDLLISNLNRTNSSSGELNTSQKVSYNDLCFPKISNYGSMKKKKHCNVGVECRLGQVVQPQQASIYGHSTRELHQ